MNTTLSDSFLRLVTIMDELREKCPWDKKQTIQSLRQMTIEETYELADAITDSDWKGIKEDSVTSYYTSFFTPGLEANKSNLNSQKLSMGFVRN